MLTWNRYSTTTASITEKHRIARWREDVSTIELNMKAPPRHMQSRTKRTAALEAYIKGKRIFDPVLLALLSAIQYDKTYFDKLTASLLPFVEKVTSGRLVELVAPTYDAKDSRPIIDWMTIMRQKAVVYIGLDAMTDKTVAEAIGGSMLSDLLSTCGYLYKYGMEKGWWTQEMAFYRRFTSTAMSSMSWRQISPSRSSTSPVALG